MFYHGSWELCGNFLCSFILYFRKLQRMNKCQKDNQRNTKMFFIEKALQMGSQIKHIISDLETITKVRKSELENIVMVLEQITATINSL